MDYKNLMVDGFSEFNVNIEKDKVDKFIQYKDFLLDYNKNINLTSITDEKEIIIKHFIDSISVLNFINLSNLKVIDIGTGAGFPGIPLKIIDDSIDITLLDSLNKRINFIEEIVQNFNFNVNAIHGRAEDFGQNNHYREKFDVCFSRAVSNLSTLSEYCLPFVKINGLFISFKGSNIDEEIENSKNAIDILGGNIKDIKYITLPYTNEQRSLIFIQKVKQCPLKYPRKSGKPNKSPLK